MPFFCRESIDYLAQFMAIMIVCLVICLIFHLLPCTPAAVCPNLHSEPWTYNITLGYVPADYPTLTAALADSDKHHLIYNCDPDSTQALYDMHFQSSNHHVAQAFHGERFLHHARNSTVLVIGDSLAKQLYIALGTELAPYETSYGVGQTLQPSRPIEPMDDHAAYFYSKTNTTVRMCCDPFLENHELCNIPAVDVLVVAVGHWFKPFFRSQPNMSFYEHLADQKHALNASAHVYRDWVTAHAPHVRVIWRLIAHVGMFDEWDFFPQYFPTHEEGHRYNDGVFWSNKTLEATWVREYNEVLRGMAEEYCDVLLDAYEMSHKYLDHFTPQGVRQHVDGMHNCPGGQPRGEVWLLQQLMTLNYHHKAKQDGTHTQHHVH